jgi:hypothetical protein
MGPRNAKKLGLLGDKSQDRPLGRRFPQLALKNYCQHPVESYFHLHAENYFQLLTPSF